MKIAIISADLFGSSGKAACVTGAFMTHQHVIVDGGTTIG